MAKDEKVKDMRLPGGKGLLLTLYGKGEHHEFDARAHTGPDEVTHVQGNFSLDLHPHSPEPGKPMPDWMQPLLQITMAMMQEMAQDAAQKNPADAATGQTPHHPEGQPEPTEGDTGCPPSGT